MFKVSIDNSSELTNDEILLDGMYLWIWQPQLTPPHLGLSSDGRYYSLQHEKIQLDQSVKHIVEAIERKNLSVFWVKIDGTTPKIEAMFANYQSCVQNECSCIKPILDVFNIRQNKAILFDLLDSLNKKGRVKEIFHLNLPYDFNSINEYTRLDVENHLLKLQS